MLKKQLEHILQKHNTQVSEALKSDLLTLLSGTLQQESRDSSTILIAPVHLEDSPKDIPAETWNFDTIFDGPTDTQIDDLEPNNDIDINLTWTPQDDDISEESLSTLLIFDESEDSEDISESNSVQTPSIGRYDDLGELGIGGMGEVRKIRDRSLNRTLAMKIIHPSMLCNQNVTARFIEEAQIGAQLQHPNIVPIHEMGRLDDGRLYFTMKEIKGYPFGHAITEVHQAIKNHRWQVSKSGWSFRRLIDAFHNACRAVAYAHSKGVLHRDLKPDNIMLGEYGEVLVVDWGIAKVLGRRDLAAEAGELDMVSTNRSDYGLNATRVGQVAGTPAYMSPEQARGEIDKLDGRTDVYALGAILYEILTGKPAYVGRTGLEILQKVLNTAPSSILATRLGDHPQFNLPNTSVLHGEIDASNIPIPEELVEICERAMQRNMDDRYQSAEELAEAVANWLDGAKKQEQALRVVEEALTFTEEKNRLQQEANRLKLEAIEQLEQIPSWENELVKSTWWAQEKKAARLLNQAVLLDTIQEQKLQGALTHKSDLEEAHIALAARYRSQHEQAEKLRNLQQITQTETRLREHVTALPKEHPERISHFYYLKGTGAVSLQTDVDDVEVILEQYVPHHRRLIPKTIAHLGRVPIVSHSLEMGSYRLVLKKTGYHDVYYPIAIGRGQHWDGMDPTGTHRPIIMPTLGTLGRDDCYVPTGWFISSGDDQSNSTLPRRPIWIEPFIVQKFPVTNRNFLHFLNTLLHEGREEDALRWVPRERAGQANQLGSMIYGRNNTGDFILVPDADGDMWELDWPVCMVDWHGAMAYAEWKGKQEHLHWRLLHELEWEKAARGVDGRFYPWGDEFDPSYTSMAQSHKGLTLPSVIQDFPLDESVYGIRGLAGNMRDWTHNFWAEDWTTLTGDPNEKRLLIPNSHASTASKYRTSRGGSWSFDANYLRCANRYYYDSYTRYDRLGFRLGRSL